MTVNIDEMPVLERRRIEALVLGPVIRAFQAEFGESRTNAIVRDVMVGIATEQGKALSARTGGENLTDYEAAKGAWRKHNALETREISSSPERYEFDVTRCRYAEMYREIGYGDLGGILSCSRDFAFGHGFNPEIELRRDHTIMSGDPICDFRYTLPERRPPSSGAGNARG
jgi:hypothetical protein